VVKYSQLSNYDKCLSFPCSFIQEKKPFIHKAAELKVEYEKAIAAYNKENDNIEDDENKNVKP